LAVLATLPWVVSDEISFGPLGFHLGLHPVPIPPGFMPGFGHAGLAGSVGWADPETGLSFGFVHNRLLTRMLLDQVTFAGLHALIRRDAAKARKADSYVWDGELPGFGLKVTPAGRKVPQANPVTYAPDSVKRGEEIFLNRCWGCHGKKADGHGPNAEDIHPRPRNLRNTPFVKSLAYARLHESIKYGVQGTAMPAAGYDFSLSDNSIGDVVNYIESLNKKGAAAPATAPAQTATTEVTK